MQTRDRRADRHADPQPARRPQRDEPGDDRRADVAFAWLADRAPLRALIVTGAGRAFCSGGDVNWFKPGVEIRGVDLPCAGAPRRRGAAQAIVDFRRIPYPVIAAVNGPAAGAGFSLALTCDIRIASEDAFFACAYGRIGASPDGGMTYFLPRVVGPAGRSSCCSTTRT